MTVEQAVSILSLSLADKEKDKEYIKQFNRNKDKVIYLRFVKKYKQKEIADMIGISERTVQRIEKVLKKWGVKNLIFLKCRVKCRVYVVPF